jgi:hypothetical protein
VYATVRIDPGMRLSHCVFVGIAVGDHYFGIPGLDYLRGRGAAEQKERRKETG